MGYKIVYGPAGPKRPLRYRLGQKLLVKILVAALLVGLRFSGLGETMRQWLIPGDAAVTTAAWNGLTEDIAAGENITDALSGFCREIIENAEIS